MSVSPLQPSASPQQQQLNIPQFVVIRDTVNNAYKHPVVHYVFDNEDFPDISRDQLIVVDLDKTATQVLRADSYNPYFQVTRSSLEQSVANDQFEDTGLLNLTIEGASVPSIEDENQLSPIRNIDSLKETIYQFQQRNKMVKPIFEKDLSV